MLRGMLFYSGVTDNKKTDLYVHKGSSYWGFT